MGKIDYDMNMVLGTVGYVSFKELTTPDNYGNTHRYSVVIEGVNGNDGKSIFFGGTLKDKGYGPQINAKFNGGWAQVEKGDSVKFGFTRNGNWFNVKGGIQLTEKGTGQAQQPQPVQINRQNPVQKTVQVGNVNPAEIGQCINLATMSNGLALADLLDKETAIKQIQLYKKVKAFLAEVWDEELPQPKKNIELEENIYDDEIPF